MNLKEVLMELGNRLVREYGFDPGLPNLPVEKVVGMIGPAGRSSSLQYLVWFTEWLNGCEDARVILEEMGIKWPVVLERSDPQ